MHELPPMQHVQRGSADRRPPRDPAGDGARCGPTRPSCAPPRVPVAGRPGLQVLAPADMVLHSATHLFYDGEFDQGLRDLVDLHRLLRHFGAAPGFWDGAAGARARAASWRGRCSTRCATARACSARRCRPRCWPAARGGAPGPLLLALMDALFGRALLPPHASCAGALSGAGAACCCICAATGCACRRCCWRATCSTRPSSRPSRSSAGALSVRPIKNAVQSD